MVERELRERIQSTAQELKEVKGELGRRYKSMMNLAKPVALVIAGYMGLKTALWATGILLSLVWRYALLFMAMVGFLLLRRATAR